MTRRHHSYNAAICAARAAHERDDLAPARGIGGGVALGLILWVLVIEIAAVVGVMLGRALP